MRSSLWANANSFSALAWHGRLNLVLKSQILKIELERRDVVIIKLLNLKTVKIEVENPRPVYAVKKSTLLYQV